jgi:hypothetical protein
MWETVEDSVLQVLLEWVGVVGMRGAACVGRLQKCCRMVVCLFLAGGGEGGVV